MSRSRKYGSRKRCVEEVNPSQEPARADKSPADMSMAELGQAIDSDCKQIGLTVAGVYKALTMAAAKLPDMDLDTERISITVNEGGIYVFVPLGQSDEDKDEDTEEYANGDYEEEGLLYDGD